jgi:aminoglycoside 3-N-acetyltransferase I
MKLRKEDFRIKRLSKQDVPLFKELVGVFQEVFDMEDPVPPKESNLLSLLSKPDFVALVVIDRNKVVGGLTAYELQLYYSGTFEMFIYDVGIQPEYRRKGLGKKLMDTLKEHCKQNGIPEFFVPANEEDTHALDFYRATGGMAERVVHFNYKSED